MTTLKLWGFFLLLTTIRFTLMPMLGVAAWLLGNGDIAARVDYTWETIAATPPPWYLTAANADDTDPGPRG